MKKKMGATLFLILFTLIGGGILFYNFWITFYSPALYTAHVGNSTTYKEFTISNLEQLEFTPIEILEQIEQREDVLFSNAKITSPQYYDSEQTVFPDKGDIKPDDGIILTHTYTGGAHTYTVRTESTNRNLSNLTKTDNPPTTEFYQNGKALLSKILCLTEWQTEHSILQFGSEDVITFNEGPCEEVEGNAYFTRGIPDMLYQGKEINEVFGFDESRQPFVYQNKLGLIATKNGKEFIVFDGKKISKEYDSIIDKACCAAPFLFELYDNGALLFMANQDQKALIAEIVLL